MTQKRSLVKRVAPHVAAVGGGLVLGCGITWVVIQIMTRLVLGS